MNGDKLRPAVDLALGLFHGERITITGTTRSGEDATMVIESGGAFAVQGNLEDIIAASQETGGRNADG